MISALKNKNCILFSFFLLPFFSLSAQQLNKAYLDYISKYKDIAIEHHHKYKIPASITLAQGLLESGAGQGRLAMKSNNHFGIKCHDWEGDRVYHDDDAKGECFRVYDSPLDSYLDHSLFLSQRNRYAPLFELSTTDYKSWAKGLSICGYATDKQYSAKLIKVIEDYELYKYDKISGWKTYEPRLPLGYMRHDLYRAGKQVYIISREGDNLKLIAEEFGLSERKLASYNEIPRNHLYLADEIVYLQRKSSKAQKPYLLHTIENGESLYAISQRYGMKLKSLYKLNKLSTDYVPSVGDVLKLR